MKQGIVRKSLEEIRAEAAALEAAAEAEYLASLVEVQVEETGVAILDGDEDAVDSEEAAAMRGGNANFDAMIFFKNF